ncbi:MAG: tRNA (guanosine(37)-N1)-methyltransferase TrmD, partial [Candidatus Berkelbacteria bacterium]
TTQPGIYDSFLNTGLIARGISKNIIDIKIHNLHDYAYDAHRSVDDTPYGGGAGMVLKVDIMANAIRKIQDSKTKCKVVLMTPQGQKFTQEKAKELAKLNEIIIIAGRFEGYDERIRDYVDEEISVGDYVLTSGDLPAQIIIEATSRMIPKFIEKNESTEIESFSENLLEYPQYTRPETFEGKKIPEILTSGNHAAIAKWRQEEAQKRTKIRRPDLLK